jgi:hypothetical protein
VFVAPLGRNGDVGAWVTTTPLPAPGPSDPQALIYRRHVYVLASHAADLLRLLFSEIRPDGTLGSWTQAVLPNVSPDYACSVTRVGDSMFLLCSHIVGGLPPDDPLVFQATILFDGTLSAWQPTTALSSGWNPGVLSVFAHGDFVYTVATAVDWRTLTTGSQSLWFAPAIP